MEFDVNAITASN